MVKTKSERNLEDLTEDELETLIALIKLDLVNDFKLSLDCGGCPGDKGCC